MLRLIFVTIIIVFGSIFSLQSAFFTLLFYLWNAYFRPEEWTYGPLVISLKLSLIIGAFLIVRTAMQVPKLQLNGRTFLLLLFLLQALAGALTSEHPLWSWYFFTDFWKVVLISYLIVVLVDDRNKFRTTLVIIGLSLGFECAKQGWVNLYRAPGAKNDNPIAFLGDNNGVALGTMMLVPILSALSQTSTRKWEKRMFQFLTIGVFMRGFSTYSRGGFLAASVIGLFMLVRSQRKVRAAFGVMVVSLLVLSVMPQTFWDRMDTITASEEERDDSINGRLHFWRVAIDMATRKPLSGVGLNGYSQSYESYNREEEFGGVRAVHSTWFGVMADLGFPGLMLFLANFGTAVWSCWRVHRMTRGDPARTPLRIYANALITSLAAFAVAGTFLASQYQEMAWHFMGLSTALYLITLAEAAAPVAVRDTVPRTGLVPALAPPPVTLVPPPATTRSLLGR